MATTHLTPEQLFAAVFNDTENYPSLADVAIELELSIQTIKNTATLLRRRGAIDPSSPEIINRRDPPKDESTIPMSEDATRFMSEWGPEECIAELRRVAEIDEDKVITRNYFRVNSMISESTWNRYFGTFEEYKRKATITLTRQQHGLERAIAKHASVDHYRDLNIDRANWGEKYVRENNTRFKTILVASDLHDIEVDRFFLRVLLDTARRVQPDIIVLNGDIFDLAEFGRYSVDPREWDAVGRIKFVHEHIFKPLREACPDTQIDFIEGNHEARLLIQLADATPALRAVLSDLHGMTVAKLLGLDKFEINYIARADLATFTKSEAKQQLQNNYKIYWDTLMCHHFPFARQMGLPGFNGHNHKHQVWPMFSPRYGAYEWHQLGCGHVRSASYCEGEKWHMGFAIANIDIQTKSTVTDYITVNDFAISGGQWYYREPHEEYATTRIP
tara:strand:- start:16695 stop:18032 length:1338 start_codon:yes stop_codon:yes gene_type:complete